MGNKIAKEVYVKRFGKKLKIEDVFVLGDEGERYVYQISYQGTSYILKGFKTRVEHVNSKDKRNIEILKQNLMQMSEMFQEYYFARTASLINPHVAKPLSLDLTAELAKDQASFSYLHVQIISEHAGVALSKLQPTTIKQTYNLMRQSANALFLLHNLEIPHFDVKLPNMVYDAKKDLLKIVDMRSAFSGSNRKRLPTTVDFERKITSAALEFAPPELLFMKKDLTNDLNLKSSLLVIDVYCWAMSFFAILTNITNIDLKNYLTKYKKESEADYRDFMKVVEIGFDSVGPENSKELDLIAVVSNLLTRTLQYKPKERSIVKDLIREMKKFEREKKYTLDYSKTELKHNKNLVKLLVYSDDVISSLNELLNKNKDKVEADNKSDLPMSLSCNHEVIKD